MADSSQDPNAWESIMGDAKLMDTSFPLTERLVQGGNEGGRLRPIGRAGQGIDPTGRKPLEFKLKIPLFNGVEGRHDLYPTVYEELLDIITNDAAEGTVRYQDPILGGYDVFVADWSEQADADHRDGCTLTLSLEEVTTADTTFIVPARTPAREVIDSAAALDAELGEANVTDEEQTNAIRNSGYPRRSDETWQSGQIFSSIALNFRNGLEVGAITSDELRFMVNEMVSRVRAIALLPALSDVAGWAAYASCLRLVDASSRLAERALSTSAPIRAVEVVGGRSAHDLALALYGDASRAEEVMRRAPSPSPWAYRQGAIIRLPLR